MRLFEDSWTVKGKTYIREYSEDLKKSIKRETPHKSEYYVQDTLGTYKGFLDGKSLRKVEGSAYNINGAYGEKSAKYVAIRDEYFGKERYNKAPNTWYLDIETKVGYNSTGFPNAEDAAEEICLIQLWDTNTKKGYVIGLEEWYNRKDYTYDFDLEYIKCTDERDLIEKFLEMFKELDPFMIYAWNGDGFDYPYIFNRLKNLKINTNRLSNYGSATLKTKKLDNGQLVHSVQSQGHQFMDMMVVYKKFVYSNVPNYSLDTIGEIETGDKKINHDNYLKFDDFRIGKYKILGNESQEQKNKKLHKAAVALETLDKEDPRRTRLQTYIQQKSYSDFVDYGVRDFVLLKGIHDAQNFTMLMTNMADQMGCLLGDVLGTLKAWDSYITNYISKDNLIAPPKESSDEQPNVVGGFVRASEIGKHRWILSSDVNSMYPLLGMASFNMSPETWIPYAERHPDVQMISDILKTQDEDKILEITTEQWAKIKAIAQEHNVALGVGGAVYRKDTQGVIPQLVTKIYGGRKQAKKEQFQWEQKSIDLKEQGKDHSQEDHFATLKNTEQMTAKIQINSLYGALAAKHFSMYNEQIAQSITGSGRYFIKMLANDVEDKLQSMIKSKEPYIVAGDTDSIYFQIAPFIDKYTQGKTITEKTKWADAFYKKVIEPVVQKSIQTLAENLNAFDPSYIGAEREIIADAGMFVAKKKYAARVRDLEGKIYPENDPYMKIQGLEIIKGGTAPFSKKYLKEAVPVILDSDEDGIREWFNNVRSKFLQVPLDEISNTAGVSKVYNPDWGKVINGRKVSIPFGSRICVTTNKYLEAQELTENYSKIEGGDKIKVLFLRQPNALSSEAFAYNDVRFAEMFKKDIDYDTTFQKFFVSPLQGMLDAIGIDLNKNTEEIDIW